MKINRLLLLLIGSILFAACDLDRARVMTSQKILDGTWRLEKMQYVDSGGKSVIVTPAGSPQNPTVTLSFIEADRIGVLRLDRAFHNFTYLFGQSECSLFFEKEGNFPVYEVGIPLESRGKHFRFDFDHIGGDRNRLQLYAERQFYLTTNEEIREVQYIFTRMNR